MSVTRPPQLEAPPRFSTVFALAQQAKQSFTPLVFTASLGLSSACGTTAQVLTPVKTINRWQVSIRTPANCSTQPNSPPPVPNFELSSLPMRGPTTGFITQFVPKSASAPCEMTYIHSNQGAVFFGVKDQINLSGNELANASLRVFSFDQEPGDVQIASGHKWDSSPQDRDELTSDRDFCFLRLRVSNQPWSDAPSIPHQPTSEINTTVSPRFKVGNGQALPITFPVTPHIRKWLDGTQETGFIIEPFDPAMYVKSSSRCVGRVAVDLQIELQDKMLGTKVRRSF